LKLGYEKRFKQGDIVYWCHHDGNVDYSVKYGMVDEQFSDAVVIDYLVHKENRLVDGVPLEQFKSETRYRKLPKGWTYYTELFDLSYDHSGDERLLQIDVTDPESVKKAYEDGFLVKDSTIYHGNVEAEITKDGFRVVRKYPMNFHHIDHVSVRPDKVYFSYDEALKEVEDNITEFYRQAALSDYDWSVEQIDKTLGYWQRFHDESDEKRLEYRNWLLGMKNVEDIETRIFNNEIQWKYWKNKKWNYIEL
jgi:hypothetical protein